MKDPKKRESRPNPPSVESTSPVSPRKHPSSYGSDSSPTSVAYTPKPTFPESHPTGGAPRRKLMILSVSAIAAIGLVIGGLALLSHRNPTVPVSSTVAAVVQPESEKILFVGSNDLNEDLTREARSALQRGQIPPSLTSATEEMRREVLSGQRALYTLRILDFAAEDGDEVDVLLNGVPFGHIPLSNSGATLTVPLRRGETMTITIIAVRDGQGGVTFAAHSSLGEARTRVMAVGESETWAISFK